MKKILLTGSTSFLGTKFIDLYGDKFKIFGISKHDPSNPIDLLDFKSLQKAYETFKPDFVIHTAAALGINGQRIADDNAKMTQNIVSLAKTSGQPFIFTSTEAVYGGKGEGGYSETDTYKPRSEYGESKVVSENIVISSGLPYLITRGHRYVGVSKRFAKPKQFPDTLNVIAAGKVVHLDSQKLFKPVLTNHICDVFLHFIEQEPDTQVILNLGVDRPTTFYDFMVDVARCLGLDAGLIRPDGSETGWPLNSTLLLKNLRRSGYPTVSYQQALDIIKADFNS
jgi:dTDP-4-dehydrorhamnose reductase